MNKTIAWRAFSKYLHDKGKSDFSESGNPSTTTDYPNRINTICKNENFSSWEELGDNILQILEKYGSNGSKSEIGNQSNGTVIKALELFREFYITFDAR